MIISLCKEHLVEFCFLLFTLITTYTHRLLNINIDNGGRGHTQNKCSIRSGLYLVFPFRVQHNRQK